LELAAGGSRPQMRGLVLQQKDKDDLIEKTALHKIALGA